MLTLPNAIVAVLLPFATLFSTPTWRKAQVLLVGAILTPGQRTVAGALRVMGRSDQRDYARYHEALNRAVWPPRQAARILLMPLLQHLDGGDGPLVFGIDETLERRRGPRIKARGIYRDAVRSSRHQLVKASGLRWISLMWLGHVPWAGRHWALPVLTVLAPSARYYQRQGRRHKRLTDWARQMILQLHRWLPQRPLALVGDNSYAVLDLLHCCQSLAQPGTLIARLRLDAALYAPAPPRQPGQNGCPPLKALLDQPQATWASAAVAWYDSATRMVGLTSQTAVWYRSGKPPAVMRWVLIRDPQEAFAPQALPCTDLAADPTQILEWFVLRWQLEVTPYQVRGRLFQEVRTHLGVETQRQWSDRAIARTTPILLRLFSWTTLAAHSLQKQRPMTQRKAAWHDKPSPTFVDAIALARRHLWLASEGFSLSAADHDAQELSVTLYHRLVDSLAYAAQIAQSPAKIHPLQAERLDQGSSRPSRFSVNQKHLGPDGRMPLNPVDTDARWRASRSGKAVGSPYQENVIVDQGGFILSRGAIHATERESKAVPDLLEGPPLQPASLAADTGYSEGSPSELLEERDITAYIPIHTNQKNSTVAKGDFVYGGDLVFYSSGRLGGYIQPRSPVVWVCLDSLGGRVESVLCLQLTGTGPHADDEGTGYPHRTCSRMNRVLGSMEPDPSVRRRLRG